MAEAVLQPAQSDLFEPTILVPIAVLSDDRSIAGPAVPRCNNIATIAAGRTDRPTDLSIGTSIELHVMTAATVVLLGHEDRGHIVVVAIKRRHRRERRSERLQQPEFQRMTDSQRQYPDCSLVPSLSPQTCIKRCLNSLLFDHDADGIPDSIGCRDVVGTPVHACEYLDFPLGHRNIRPRVDSGSTCFRSRRPKSSELTPNSSFDHQSVGWDIPILLRTSCRRYWHRRAVERKDSSPIPFVPQGRT